MRLARTIRFDESDDNVFEATAAPDEWAVSGAFAFSNWTEADLVGKKRQAFANGWLGLESFGRSTFVAVAQITEAEYAGAVDRLARHFVEVSSRQIKKRVAGITTEAMDALRRYRWPGNIRELENVIERAVIMVEPGGEIGLQDLPGEFSTPQEAVADDPKRSVHDAEREMLIRALREAGWNRTKAAKALGIGRRTLYDKLARYGISLKPSP